MDKVFLGIIVFLNIIAIYIGLTTYQFSLQATSPLLWIFLVDCPLAAGLFVVSFWKKEFRPFAFVASIKYSFWTFLAYLSYWDYFSGPGLLDDSIALIVGHVALVAQAVIFGTQRIDKKYLAIMLLFFLSNDLLDYFYLMNLSLPTGDFIFPLTIYNILASITIPLFVNKYAWKGFVEK